MKEIEELLKNESLEENEKLKKQAFLFKLQSAYYSSLGNYEKAIEISLKQINLEEKLDNTVAKLSAVLNLGITYGKGGYIEKGSEFFNKIISENKKFHEVEIITGLAYSNLGNSYYLQGEYDKALENFNKALDISIKLSDKNSKIMTLLNLSLLYIGKGEYDYALQNLKLSLDMAKEIKDLQFEVYSYLHLIEIYLIKKDKANALINFDEIQSKLIDYPENNLIQIITLFAKGLLLKNSDRMADHGEAQKLLHEVISKKEAIDDVTIPAYLHYQELLLEELKQTGNPDVLQEIEELNKKLTTLAKDQHSHSLLAETLLIEAKISIIKLDFKKARKLLTQAQISAEEKGLRIIAQKISKEHDNLLNRLDKWESLVDENTSIQERVNLADLEQVLRTIIVKGNNKVQDEQEDGLIFLILKESGISIYSKIFVPDSKLEDQLIGGLLTAMNTFVKETFEISGTIERIKQGDHMILMKNINSLNMCYAFKGPSYYANKKFNSLVTKIENNKPLLHELENENTNISELANHYLNDLTEEIFITKKG